MKFRHYLENIAGIGIYPLISLMIFFVFFISLIIFVLRIDKKSLQNMESMPLSDGLIKKRVLLFFFFFLVSVGSFARGTSEPVHSISGTELILLLFLGVLFFLALLLVILLFDAISLLRKTPEQSVNAKVETIPTVSWWKKFAGMSVMPSDEKHLIIPGHDYDGIQELDNRMPPWLQSLFIGTIIIAIGYATYYFSGIGDYQLAELDKEVAQAEIDKKAYMEKVGASMDENTVTLITDDAVIAQGKIIFQEKCIACHGPDGGGTVGPNLTDGYWLHGAGIKNLFKVIKYGVPEKGMISWEKQLSPAEIQKVASYVFSLKDTKPANPKEPQGDLVNDDKVAAN